MTLGEYKQALVRTQALWRKARPDAAEGSDTDET